MNVNLEEARRFVAALTGDPDAVCTWQTFDDNKERSDPSLAKVLHGKLIDVAPTLIEYNSRRAGVFICVNATDLRGRSNANIVSLRALFVDNDNGEPLTLAVKPSIRVGTVHGEHLYWLLEEGEPIAKAKPALRAMAKHLRTDPQVAEAARVLRVPGFLHCKGEPTPIALLGVNTGRVWTIDGLLEDLGIPSVVAPAFEPPKSGPNAAVNLDGVDHFELIRLCYERMSKIEPAIEGRGGDSATYVACMCGRDFGLSDEDFWPILSDWNNRCRPPWSENELKRKLANATKYRKEPAGKKAKDIIDNTPPPITDDDAPPEVKRAAEAGKKTWQGQPYEPSGPVYAKREPGSDDDKQAPPINRLRAISQAEALEIWKASKLRQSVSTGISDLDAAIGGGLPVGQVTTVLGYTGVGKSEFARQLRRNAAALGHPVIHVDVELGASRILERDLAQLTGIPAGVLRSGKLSPEEDAEAAKGEAQIREQTNIVTISPGCGVTPPALEKAIGEAMAAVGNCKPALLIIDSLQRLSLGADGESLRVQMLNFNAWVEAFARANNVAVLVTSEQRRTQDGKIPSVADVLTSGAESRSIEFGCDVLIGLVPKDKLEDQIAGPCDEEREREIELVIAKNRNGGPGYCRSSVVFMAPCWRMRVEQKARASIEILIMSELGDTEAEALSASDIGKKIHRRKGAVLEAMGNLYNRNMLYQIGSGPRTKWYRVSVPGAETDRVLTSVPKNAEPQEPKGGELWKD